MQLFLRIYGGLMITLPIFLITLLLNKPAPFIQWDAAKLSIVIILTIAGWAGGLLVLSLPKNKS